MKGISPVVSAVLLLAIVIVAALGIYYWTSIYSSQPSTSNPPAWIAASPVGKGKVLIVNLGRTEINTSEFRTSDPEVNVTCEDAVLNPGEQTVCHLKGNPSSSTIVILGTGVNVATVSSELVWSNPTIHNLQPSSKSCTWIYWTWSSNNVDHTMVYLNGSFIENVTVDYYNATGFDPGTTHEIELRPVGDDGSLGAWANDTESTLVNNPPSISNVVDNSSSGQVQEREHLQVNATVTDPENNLDVVWLEYNISTCGHIQYNKTMENTNGDVYSTVINTIRGDLFYRVWANDTLGEESISDWHYVKVSAYGGLPPSCPYGSLPPSYPATP